MSANEKVVSSSNLSYKSEKLQMNYYQGLSLVELGKKEEAREVFKELIAYHKKKSMIDAKIDYFAISVPEFLISDMDLNAINQTHCFYIIGLGYLGLEDVDSAKKYFKKAITYDINHFESAGFFE